MNGMNGQIKNGHFHNILIGYDGSPESERALAVGLSMARDMESTVEVLAVAFPPEPEPATSGELQAVLDDARALYCAALAIIAASAKENGIHVETDIAVGHPAEQIIRRAEQNHADLIVVGRRGTSTFEKLVMGSVSERVLRYAPCPVLVTRQMDYGHSLS
jgi:nucleotide-binding universal stress UspA family protein